MSSSQFDSGISPPHGHSSPFSISDILSKDIGQKKSPPSSSALPFSTLGSSGVRNPTAHSMFSQDKANNIKYSSIDTPKRPRKNSGSHFIARNPKMSLLEAENVLSSGGLVHAGHHDNQMAMLTPHKPSSTQMSTSLVSPFNANLLLALGHRPSPSKEEKEELFGENSLGMLSEVAQYHSELSGAEANSSLEAPVREKFANIRLINSSGYSDGPHEASYGGARDVSLIPRCRKTSTPGILKRDKRRKRVMSTPHFTSGRESAVVKPSQAHLDSGFLSPHSNEKSSASKELTFSPSIFLSRPDHTLSMSSSDHTHSSTSSIPIPRTEAATIAAAAPPSRLTARFSVSPSSDSDCVHSLSDTTDNDGGSFVTSTPIKSGKENHARSDSDEGWSPTILLSKRRRHLREPNETSSGSESDAVKRPRFQGPHRRKSKARTKLSPLLENACSPISKGTVTHPSPLAATPVTTPTQHAVVSRPQHLALASSGTMLPIASASSGTMLPITTASSGTMLPITSASSGTMLPITSASSGTMLPITTASSGTMLPIASASSGTMLPITTASSWQITGARSGTTLPSTNSCSRTALPSTSGSLMTAMSITSASGPALPVSMPHPSPVPPGFLGSRLVTGAVSLPGQTLLTTAPSPMVLNRPFPAVSALLPQLSQHGQNLLLQQNPLLRLQTPYPYNPLAPACNSSALQTYGSITAGGIPPGYLPLVGLIAPHPNHPSSYLSYSSPYMVDTAQIVAMNSSGHGRAAGEVGSRRDSRHMRSVPPWFIFSNCSEKRSRLTEAINKSLSETPSQTKLPAEWTKYACGQTDDQKNMTEEARYFMQLRPRHMTFSEDMD